MNSIFIFSLRELYNKLDYIINELINYKNRDYIKMSHSRDILPIVSQVMRSEVVQAKWQWLFQKVRFQGTQHPPIPKFCTLSRAEKTVRTLVRWLIRTNFIESIESLKAAVRNYARLRRICTDAQTGVPLPSQSVAAHGRRDIRCRALDSFAPGSYAWSPIRGDEDE